nr:MAG TPA: hypothetical protein [Caudoviricetes sp.]
MIYNYYCCRCLSSQYLNLLILMNLLYTAIEYFL